MYSVIGSEIDRIESVDVETGEVRVLAEGRYPRYSNTGHLLFQDATETTLLSASFDVDGRELTGAPIPLVEGLLAVGSSTQGLNPGNFAVSQTGRIVYRTGAASGFVEPVWVERDGTARAIDPAWGSLLGAAAVSTLAISPNGERLAISIVGREGTVDVSVKELDTGPLSRLTFEGSVNYRAAWSPDGQSLTFISNRAGESDVWTKRADGGGTAERVLNSETAINEAFYSQDGAWLIFREGATAVGVGDIYAIRPGVDSAAVELSATEFTEYSPALSPDDRWLAYVSDQSGQDEVYVIPFPEGRVSGGLVQVSANGGRFPVWAHNGRELFYRNASNELVAVRVTGDSTFVAGQQEVLFSLDEYLPGFASPMYDVSPDDERFVMLWIGGEVEDTELIMVENWAGEFQQRTGS